MQLRGASASVFTYLQPYLMHMHIASVLGGVHAAYKGGPYSFVS